MSGCMIANTIVEIPISLIVFASVYLAGVWITMFAEGISEFPDDNCLIVISALLWPMFWVVVAVDNGVEKINEVLNGENSHAKTIMLFLGRVVSLTVLPFRPFMLGSKLSAWRKARIKRG